LSNESGNRVKVKRTKFLINPRFQLRFVAYYLFAVVGSITVFFLAVKYFFNQMYQEGINLNLPLNHVYFKMIVEQEELMTNIFIITSIVVSILLFVFGILLSHRVAGPFVKLNNYLKCMGQGESRGKLFFRKRDFFQEIPESFNEMIDFIEKKEKDGVLIFSEMEK